MDAKIVEKLVEEIMLKSPQKLNVFVRFLHAFCIDFGITFCSIFASKPSKTSSKNLQKNYTIFASIFQRFSMDLGPHFRAKLAHLGTKLAIKAPLEALLGALGRLFGSKMLPKRPPEAPRPPQTSIFIDFLVIFGRIWMKISLIC